VKLYVWNDPYGVKYGGSCLYVVANDEDEARLFARTARVAKYGMKTDETRPDAMQNLGKPDRVYNCPCAEIYEWSE
jgi:hypothetical protein